MCALLMHTSACVIKRFDFWENCAESMDKSVWILTTKCAVIMISGYKHVFYVVRPLINQWIRYQLKSPAITMNEQNI